VSARAATAKVSYKWHLRMRMAERGMFATAHSGDYGHPFRFKADTVPVESGQVQEQAVPVVAVRLSSGPRHTPGPLDRLHGVTSGWRATVFGQPA
jgi:hypothetical protein